MPWHHIIPKHEWKKRFGNLKGFNCPENRVNLTTEQHGHVHMLLYELNGNEYDKIASLGILSQIGKEEIMRKVVSEANKGNTYNRGRIHTKDQNIQHSIFMKGRKQTQQEKENQIKSQIGRVLSIKTKLLISERLMGNKNSIGNKNTVGCIPWNKGKIIGELSAQHKQKLSLSQQRRRAKERGMLCN